MLDSSLSVLLVCLDLRSAQRFEQVTDMDTWMIDPTHGACSASVMRTAYPDVYAFALQQSAHSFPLGLVQNSDVRQGQSSQLALVRRVEVEMLARSVGYAAGFGYALPKPAVQAGKSWCSGLPSQP